MNLYLVRHTRVQVPPGTCYGQTDVPLAFSFPEEAREICTKLGNVRFTHCFSSPLTRCRRLAEKIAPIELSVCLDDRLMELAFGAWEGKTWSSFEQTPPAVAWFGDYLHTPCLGGESYLQLQERILSFLDDLARLPESSEVLLVTHGGPIRSFLSLLGKTDTKKMFETPIEYGSILKLEF